ncbi:MAG TPA: DUF1178 family protein [Rhizomicrobium sp.]
MTAIFRGRKQASVAKARDYDHLWTCVPRVGHLIVYSLHCAEGHAFEGWFANSSAFDAQQRDGTLVCPVCGVREVTKAPMAPALSPSVGKQKLTPAPQELRKMRQFMTGLRKYIEENAQNVGRDFPEEARKIHYGEAEERHIYGEATLKEAEELVEEGVDVAPLPPDMSETN